MRELLLLFLVLDVDVCRDELEDRGEVLAVEADLEDVPDLVVLIEEVLVGFLVEAELVCLEDVDGFLVEVVVAFLEVVAGLLVERDVDL